MPRYSGIQGRQGASISYQSSTGERIFPPSHNLNCWNIIEYLWHILGDHTVCYKVTADSSCAASPSSQPTRSKNRDKRLAPWSDGAPFHAYLTSWHSCMRLSLYLFLPLASLSILSRIQWTRGQRPIRPVATKDAHFPKVSQDRNSKSSSSSNAVWLPIDLCGFAAAGENGRLLFDFRTIAWCALTLLPALGNLSCCWRSQLDTPSSPSSY